MKKLRGETKIKMKNVEEEQYGAIHAAEPEEEWIKPKSNKVVVYHLKKENFYSIFWDACFFLFCSWGQR